MSPSLPCGSSPCPAGCDRGALGPAGTARLYEEFPAYGSVLLRLANVNLRTVIVTAAVHWGFISARERLHLTFQHRAGVTPYTSPCGLAECCGCDNQSLEPIHCARLGL